MKYAEVEHIFKVGNPIKTFYLTKDVNLDIFIFFN